MPDRITPHTEGLCAVIWHLLVSHPAHLIAAVAPGSEVCRGVTRLGIGYMTIGLDFIVQPEAAS